MVRESRLVGGERIDVVEYADAFVVYAWPRHVPDGAPMFKELGIFKTLKQAQRFMRGLLG